MLGFPCGWSCRGLLLFRSLSSSTCSIFSITWRAEHRGWACPGAPHLPLSGWVWAAWPFCHLPSPGASRCPPVPLSSAACPGSASAVQPVAAEPGVGRAAPFLDHSSDGAGGRGERRGNRGALGPEGPPQPSLLSPPLPWPLTPMSLFLLLSDTPSRAPFPSALRALAYLSQFVLQMLVPQLLHVQLTQQQFPLHGCWWWWSWLREEAPPNSNGNTWWGGRWGGQVSLSPGA